MASLLCSLGWHSPGRTRWNRGLCFSRCRRCGRDLVRKDSGGWRVPKGFRVVWRSSRDVVAPPLAEPAPAPARDFMDDGWDSGRWADDLVRRAAAANPGRVAGDFMDDERPSRPPPPSRVAARRSD